MSKEKILVKCTGPDKHINEYTLKDVLFHTPVVRRIGRDSKPPSKRVIRKCKFCDNTVIISLDMFD